MVSQELLSNPDLFEEADVQSALHDLSSVTAKIATISQPFDKQIQELVDAKEEALADLPVQEAGLRNLIKNGTVWFKHTIKSACGMMAVYTAPKPFERYDEEALKALEEELLQENPELYARLRKCVVTDTKPAVVSIRRGGVIKGGSNQ